MVSFHSRSLQYKKLSCLQRRLSSALCGHGCIAILYHPHHHPGKRSWTQPWKCILLPPSLQQTGGQDLWTPSSASDAIPTCSSGTRLHEALERGTGAGSTAWNQGVEVSLSPAEPNLSAKEPTQAEGSQTEPGRARQSQAEWSKAATSMPETAVEWSLASEVLAWWEMDSFTFGDLSVIAFCCQGLGDRESQLQEVTTILSLLQLPHRTKLRRWTPPVCKAPSLLHTFILNIAAATVHFLLHCFVLPENCYLNAYCLPLSLSYQKGREKEHWLTWSVISSYHKNKNQREHICLPRF